MQVAGFDGVVPLDSGAWNDLEKSIIIGLNYFIAYVETQATSRRSLFHRYGGFGKLKVGDVRDDADTLVDKGLLPDTYTWNRYSDLLSRQIRLRALTNHFNTQ